MQSFALSGCGTLPTARTRPPTMSPLATVVSHQPSGLSEVTAMRMFCLPAFPFTKILPPKTDWNVKKRFCRYVTFAKCYVTELSHFHETNKKIPPLLSEGIFLQLLNANSSFIVTAPTYPNIFSRKLLPLNFFPKNFSVLFKSIVTLIPPKYSMPHSSLYSR